MGLLHTQVITDFWREQSKVFLLSFHGELNPSEELQTQIKQILISTNGSVPAGNKTKTQSLFGLIDSFDVDCLTEYQLAMQTSNVTQGWLLKKVDITKQWSHIEETDEIVGKSAISF